MPQPGPVEPALCGWLSPDGVFYPCAAGTHLNQAAALWTSLLGHPSSNTPDQNLLNVGWIQLTSMANGLSRREWIRLRRATRRQCDAIWDWVSAQPGRQVPWWWEEEV